MLKFLPKTLITIGVASAVFSCQPAATDNETNENIMSAQDSVYQQLLDKYVSVPLTADLSGLSENQRKMIPLLIEVGQIMDGLFWKEAYGDKEALLSGIENERARRFAEINYGPWDRLDGNRSFLAGIGNKPAGATYYPADMTKEEFEAADLENKASL